jgi:hypothetical protein
MAKILRTNLALRGLFIALAAVAPMAFPASQAGYSTLYDLAFLAVIPAAVLLVVAWAILRNSPLHELAATLRNGALAGAFATIALEAVRYTGFRMGFMPGNLPELMGVLLFDLRFRPDHGVHSRRVHLPLLEWSMFWDRFRPRTVQAPELVSDSLRSRGGNWIFGESRRAGIGGWHFRRKLRMALRRDRPCSPLGVRCGDGSGAQQELGRSRTSMSALRRHGIVKDSGQ